MGELPQTRGFAASISLDNVGTYLIGGHSSSMKRTSDFLLEGSTEWAAGPDLPVDMDRPCGVRISQLSFLIIHGNDIREYQVDTSNPTSSSGWQSASKFPQLQTYRINSPGCGKIGDQVVIAGGSDGSRDLRSTEVLNLSTKTIGYAGFMNSRRRYFHMGTITMNGQQTLFAFGGYSGSLYLNSIEQFDPISNTWILALTSMEEARSVYAATVVPEELICG